MANSYFHKKIIILLLFFFFFGRSALYAQAPPPVEQEVTISAQVESVESVEITPSSSSGSGIGIPKTAVQFSGQAYPGATIFVLKGGVEVLSVLADKLGNFSATLPEQYNSTTVYTLFAQDITGNRSLLINYPLVVYIGFLTHLGGIHFAPTIVTDKIEVRIGDYLTAFGYGAPQKDMEAFISGIEKKTFTLASKADGSYRITIPILDLPKGNYTIYIRYAGDSRISKLVKFVIGEANILSTEGVLNIPGDCNSDSIINLVDFSVLAFWYGKSNPSRCVDTNSDNKIDLIDFSILAFWWTG